MKKKILVGLLALGLVLTACSKENKMEMDKNEMKKDEMSSEKKEDTQDKGTEKSEKKEMKNQGEQAFDFELPDLKGNKVKLSELKGKKVYLKFWASWCPICLAGLSELDEMSKNSKDFEIITIVSPGHLGEKNEKDFTDWFNSLEYKNIRVLLDKSGKVISDYGVRSTPTNAIIGSDGVLIKIIPGQLSKDVIEKIFKEVK